MIDTGDTSFVLICTAMICFMTPAVGVFYAGLIRKKNAIDIMMQTFLSMGVVMPLWFVFGFSLAYGSDIGGIIGGLEPLFLNDVGLTPSSQYATTIPFQSFFVLQVMFAIIAPSLIVGSMTERATLKGYLLFLILWSILIYIPLVHWVWGGGFLNQLGLIDYAGGTVIHMSAGFSSLAAAIVLGPRKKIDNTPHSLITVFIGVAVIWFGWLAFNGSSAFSANGIAVNAVTNSQLSASFGMLTWLVLVYLREKRPSLLGALMGGLAGLVVVTPSAGYIENWAAPIIGIIGTIICFTAITIRPKIKIDDTLDVWALHGVGGLAGVLFAGIFTNKNISGFSGFLNGNYGQIGIQLLACIITACFSFLGTFIILKLLAQITELRVPEKIEQEGLDFAIYQEKESQ